MKARKTMKNQPLIREVISQISQRFMPKIPAIKKVCRGIWWICYNLSYVLNLFFSLCRQSTCYLRKNILSESITWQILLHTLHNSLYSFFALYFFSIINCCGFYCILNIYASVIPFHPSSWHHFILICDEKKMSSRWHMIPFYLLTWKYFL
jgi:hypothetical protein